MSDVEIREHIATYLPTVDFLALREASRSMTNLFHSQHFWRSRFSIGQERGFLRYLLRKPKPETDWRLLYMYTTDFPGYVLNTHPSIRQPTKTRLEIHTNSEAIRDRILMRMAPSMELQQNSPKNAGAWCGKKLTADLALGWAPGHVRSCQKKPMCTKHLSTLKLPR
jgi:hypothetical protein